MPSKIKQIQIRLPWLRKQQGDKADLLAKAMLDHPNIRDKMEESRCPICDKPFNDCEYFRRLDND